MHLNKTEMLTYSIISLIISTSFFPIVNSDDPIENTFFVPDDYPTIQQAIDNASNGDTVIIRDGTYGTSSEAILVNKQISLQSENGSANCIIHSNVFEVTVSYVTIKDLTIQPLSIRLENADHCVIANNTIMVGGGTIISLYSYSTDNIIINNTIQGTNRKGLGIRLSDGCNYNRIINNTLTELANGIDLQNSHYNQITGNNIHHNGYTYYNSHHGTAIALSQSDNNTITKNEMANNRKYGIQLSQSNSNLIYLNNFIDNQWGTIDTSNSNNTWNSTNKITYEHQGESYYHYIGNYWYPDYPGYDSNGNGVGDESYIIDDNNSDYYPLIMPWKNYFNDSLPNIIFVPDDYPTIQQAIDNASNGDTVIIRDGTYGTSSEAILVNKQISLQSENGSANCIIHSNVFEVTVSYVTIKDLTIQPLSIRLENADHCVIANNTIMVGGGTIISLYSYSTDNIIINNTIQGTNRKGLGIRLSDGCNYNRIINNTLTELANGIDLQNSHYNQITGNNIHHNGYTYYNSHHGTAIALSQSDNNTITKNEMANNRKYGIQLSQSNSNLIYLNNFIDNQRGNVHTSNSNNTWNKTNKITYEYQGYNYYNYLGNYWYPDYTGNDADNDGIGDTSYEIDGNNNDFYPLTENFTNYSLSETQPPLPPTIAAPGSGSSPGAEILSLTPTLEWDAVSGADYYALAIRKDPPNGPIVYNPQKVYGTSHEVPVDTLETDHEYRWNMQARGAGGWSDVSNTLYFQTSSGNQPPSCSITLEYNDQNIERVYKNIEFEICIEDYTSEIDKIRLLTDHNLNGEIDEEHTETMWYDWTESSNNWDAIKKVFNTSFQTGGLKEIWVEIKSENGLVNLSYNNIFVIDNYPPISFYRHFPKNLELFYAIFPLCIYYIPNYEIYENIVFESYSIDLDGNIVLYEWDFGDGTTSYGKKCTHAYSEEGVYTVKLKVKDNENKESEYSITLHITDSTLQLIQKMEQQINLIKSITTNYLNEFIPISENLTISTDNFRNDINTDTVDISLSLLFELIPTKELSKNPLYDEIVSKLYEEELKTITEEILSYVLNSDLSNYEYRDIFMPEIKSNVNENISKISNTATNTLEELQELKPKELRIYLSDLQKRKMANMWMSELYLGQAKFVNLAREIKKTDEESFSLRAGKALFSGSITLFSVGTGMSFLSWGASSYSDWSALVNDVKLWHLGHYTLRKCSFEDSNDFNLNVVNGISYNTLQGFNNIKNRNMPIIPDIEIDNEITQQENAYTLTIRNKENIETKFRLLYNYEHTYCSFELLPLGPVGERAYDIKTYGIDPLGEDWGILGPKEEKTIVLELPDDTSKIVFYLLGKTNTGIYGMDMKTKIRGNMYDKVNEFILSKINSPVEQYVLDEQNQKTGLINGNIMTEIPNSIYNSENEAVVLFPPFSTYKHIVNGKSNGTYGLEILSSQQKITIFNATNIPILANAKHQYTINWPALSEGEKGVTIKIDDDGDGTFEQTIITDNTFQPPEANFTYYPNKKYITETVTFNASGSYDSDGNIVNWTWDFDDGTFGYGEIVTHSFDNSGVYETVLTVTDDDGLTHKMMKKVEVLIPSTIDINPDTLNKNSNGKWITSYIELAEDFNPAEINSESILLNNLISPENHPVNVGDYDNDGIQDLMVKFDRQSLIDILETGDNIEVKITGEMVDGMRFEGIDTIKVI